MSEMWLQVATAWPDGLTWYMVTPTGTSGSVQFNHANAAKSFAATLSFATRMRELLRKYTHGRLTYVELGKAASSLLDEIEKHERLIALPGIAAPAKEATA